MSISFESLYQRMRKLNIRTMDRHNFRRLTLDDYLGKGLGVIHKVKKASFYKVKITPPELIHGFKDIANEAELDSLLERYEHLRVVENIWERPPTIDLKPSRDIGGPYYEVKFRANEFKWFKKWYFSKEEGEVRRILKSICEKEGVYSTASHIGLSVRGSSRNYDEMLGILRCIDELYAMMIDKGYHDPSGEKERTGVQRRFELPRIRAAASWRYKTIVVDSSDLKYLLFDMLNCKRKGGGFTLENDILIPATRVGDIDRTKMQGRQWIGVVYDKKFDQSHKEKPSHQMACYNLCGKIVAAHK